MRNPHSARLAALALTAAFVAGCGGEKADPAGETPAPTPEATTEAPPSNVVLLGSPELTAGIPGEGPLSVAQVEAWLADPANHEELEVRLPLGLSAGQSSIVGLDANPLTRAKIELGRQLFFDPRLSADGKVSCATCHDPDMGYAAHTRFGVGIRGKTGNRNSPTAYNRILSGAQFWDGRAATLEDQAIGPIENPIEMANSHEECVATLYDNAVYRLQFDKIFGDTTIANVGKAIASFERALVTGPSPFDYYEQMQRFADVTEEELAEDAEFAAQVNGARAAAAAQPMSESAIRGRDLYFGEANCSACHAGPNLTNELYHNLGVGMDAADPDLGRHGETGLEKDKGAFKTPTVRNVALTAPYMHDGSLETLEDVVKWYVDGGHVNATLDEKIVPLAVSEQGKADLVEFMKACTGPLPEVERGRLPADTPAAVRK